LSTLELVNLVDEFSVSSGKTIQFYSLPALQKTLGSRVNISRLPLSIRILLESLLRNKDGKAITDEDIFSLASWNAKNPADREIPFKVSRVLMQDLTGVPALVDLAAMREAVVRMRLDAKIIEPEVPIDLIIDHSIQVDAFRNKMAFQINAEKEIERNRERYEFLKWAQQAFKKLKLVPPDTGICHQVNLEFLATVATVKDLEGKKALAFPDTLVGTDSHTPMINGLGVLGWGVGGIEAEAALLGQPVTFVTPRVVGVHLSGELRDGVTATDVVLTITQILRNLGVVDAFVEFFGEGVSALTVAGRATISNMTPEFGATASLFPVDEETLHYLRLTGRSEAQVEAVKKYYEAQEMFGVPADSKIDYSQIVKIDLSSIEPSIAGPSLPQDRVPLARSGKHLVEAFPNLASGGRKSRVTLDGKEYLLEDGDVVIAAITSCTNTSNPDVMIAAGLLAKRAVELGMTVRDVVKTSMAPGSMVVTEYLRATGLLPYLEKLGFGIVGYGCTTCIGNSGPLPDPVVKAIKENNLTIAAVLSGNRNFEARIHQDVRANFLMSPPLVVAFALAGTIKKDLTAEPVGVDADGGPVYLKDLWPSHRQVMEYETQISAEMFRSKYAQVYDQNSEWNKLESPTGQEYRWDEKSTYIQLPPYFEDYPAKPETGKKEIQDLLGARPLLILGDYVTTDHISPAGAISPKSVAGKYLLAKGVSEEDFNSYGSRRGNHEVMIRGTFANPRIKNLMLGNVEGSITKHYPDGETLPIYDVAMKYKTENVPLIVIAGKGFGTGSSRDWAAKGQKLLGVRAVIAESFERIHRSNLIGMGVLPLQFDVGTNTAALSLDGTETFSVTGIARALDTASKAKLQVRRKNGEVQERNLKVRLDSIVEREYYESGGILDFVLAKTVRARSK
jgi:aconitate hydratase